MAVAVANTITEPTDSRFWLNTIARERLPISELTLLDVEQLQCAAKKYPLKFFCDFLSNRSEFLHEISHTDYSFIIT